MDLDVRDILAINNLINLYGHVIDDRLWFRMEELFTFDIVFDMTSFGPAPIHGLEPLRTLFRAMGDRHPIAHHATNILIDAESDTVRVMSKGIGFRKDGPGSTTYHDVLRRTPAGWRIAHRIAIKRERGTIPESG